MRAKWHHLPRGSHQCPEGKRTGCEGMKRVLFLMLGILLWTLSPIRSEAAASCQTSIDGIPDDIKQYCEEIGAETNICPEILEAIAYHESRFIPTVKNKNYWGLCQVNVKIHKDRIEALGYTPEDMLTAYPNIKVAADYLADLYETYGDENPIVLSLYSGAGWDAVEKYKEYGQMTDYVEDILTRGGNYERLHGK